MTTIKVTDESVTNFLKEFIAQISMDHYAFDADDYIVEASTNKRLTLGTPAKPIYVYRKNPHDDGMVINPFAEVMGRMSPAMVWFYNKLISSMVAVRFIIILRECANIAEKQKVVTAKKKNEAAGSSLPELLDIASIIADVVDDKFKEELLVLANSPTEMIDLVYDPTICSINVKSEMIDEPRWIKSKNIRVKSLDKIKLAVLRILGVKSMDDYNNGLKLAELYRTRGPDDVPPRLGAYLYALKKIFLQINPYLKIEPEAIFNLHEFVTHLGLLPNYRTIASWHLDIVAKQAPSPGSSASVLTSSVAPAKSAPTNTNTAPSPTSSWPSISSSLAPTPSGNQVYRNPNLAPDPQPVRYNTGYDRPSNGGYYDRVGGQQQQGTGYYDTRGPGLPPGIPDYI